MLLPLLRKGDYIYGSFVNPESTNGFINDSNPGNREDHIGRFPFSLANASKAIAYAKAVQPSWAQKPLQERLDPAKEFRCQLERRMKYIAHILTREIGLPVWEAHQEIKQTMHLLNDVISNAPKILQAQPLYGEKHFPLGTLAAMTPYSLALQTPALFSVAAIVSGNTLVHKPSKYTPGLGQCIAELWDRCKLPRGVYNMVQGPGSQIGQAFLSNPHLDGLLFAGSYSTASNIRKKALPSIPLFMYMGGKSNAILLEDANVEDACRAILASAFRATGQRPSAISRVIVPTSLFQQVKNILSNSSEQISIGHGEEPNVYIGPLISEHWRTRYHRYGRNLHANGHQSIRPTANVQVNKRGFYVQPAIYQIQWRNGAPMIEDEPPGPFILLYETNNIEDSIQLHNQFAFRRMTSVFTNMQRTDLHKVVQQIDTGAVFLNQAPQEISAPVTGAGKSSNGVQMGMGLLSLLTRKSVTFSPNKSD